MQGAVHGQREVQEATCVGGMCVQGEVHRQREVHGGRLCRGQPTALRPLAPYQQQLPPSHVTERCFLFPKPPPQSQVNLTHVLAISLHAYNKGNLFCCFKSFCFRELVVSDRHGISFHVISNTKYQTNPGSQTRGSPPLPSQ